MRQSVIVIKRTRPGYGRVFLRTSNGVESIYPKDEPRGNGRWYARYNPAGIEYVAQERKLSNIRLWLRKTAQTAVKANY